ncbi:MAG: helix-turn-helix transcriptional regulator [Enterocloster asparagiformis]|nr:helix-turn-helix transcriptional regulator [Enterocloster asparagiformis]
MAKSKVHKPYNRLKGALRERGLTYSDIAKTLEISETAVGFKINGTSDFYVSEVELLCSKYKFTVDIFLP